MFCVHVNRCCPIIPVAHNESNFTNKPSVGQELLGKKAKSWELIQSLQGEAIICDRSHDNYEWCFLNRPSILDKNSTTFSTIGSQSGNSTEKIRPYPRKWEKLTMSLVSEITLTTWSIEKPCEIYHETPALVFSVSGYTGNFFHDFNDGIIPLYITLNTLFPDQDVTLVIADFTNWWYSKYEVLLRGFTKQPVINLNNQTSTHCFTSVAVGLISHGPMTIKPIQNPYKKSSFLDLRSLFEIAYSKCSATLPPPLEAGKPRIVFMSRTGNVGRVILNQDQIIEAVKKAGFDVVLFQPTKFTYLCDAYRLINGSHGMIGVHGAALTHSLFLRPGSVFIQIVPLGNDWLADSYFKNLATGLRFQYLEYKIRPEESSLAKIYGLNHVILRNPNLIIRGNWSALDTIYLKKQDVNLDFNRFRMYLEIAFSKANMFLDKRG
ncbi:xylan glycosyltransferase MUCI21-like isoform X2 [Spinacia oleracea]|uniref:Xylan glycosyltransferase MUCI21-like isoform X2 n=1 Tax=Spinacia oleracea TaxID=3562 RepID=A0ABM3QZG6_SPIOL|nr:xylan glycosyltransferase MUCI21-like isoform X2 [Spinacia oleracea]XP_056688718.1 xylan glycosyltransferase MUCI21-like isoform X2 [Spinacia oleracea]